MRSDRHWKLVVVSDTTEPFDKAAMDRALAQAFAVRGLETMIEHVPVPEVNTAATAYAMHRFAAFHQGDEKVLITHGVTPKTETVTQSGDPKPHRRLHVGRFGKNGPFIAGPNIGYALGLVIPECTGAARVDIGEGGHGQFPMRDLYPRHLAAVASGDIQLKVSRGSQSVQPLPEGTVLWNDNFGTLTLGIRKRLLGLHRCDVVEIIIGNRLIPGIVCDRGDYPPKPYAYFGPGSVEPYWALFWRAESSSEAKAQHERNAPLVGESIDRIAHTGKNFDFNTGTMLSYKRHPPGLFAWEFGSGNLETGERWLVRELVSDLFFTLDSTGELRSRPGRPEYELAL